MNDVLLWMMAHLGRRGTALLLTALILLAFVAFLLFIVWFAVKFPGIALGAAIVIALVVMFSQFIFALAESIERMLPERKGKDETSHDLH